MEGKNAQKMTLTDCEVASLKLKPLSHQVAGHMQSKDQSVKDVFLECEDGTMLKPIQSPPRGEREWNFYEKVFNPDIKDPVLLQLREMLPKFHKRITLEHVPGVEYLKLEDITCQFCKPCIVDIKMGPITYDPEATPEKIAKEKSKYPPLEKLGFQLRGMRIYDPEEKTYEYFGKEFLRKLQEDEVLSKGLKKFFSIKNHLRSNVVEECLTILKRIENWFEEQTQFSFYASSLLIVYEGAIKNNVTDRKSISYIGTKRKLPDHAAICGVAHKNGAFSDKDKEDLGPPSKVIRSELKGDIDESKSQSFARCSVDAKENTHGVECTPLIDVRMIDFAHVFPTEKKDENYLFGLRSLIKYMQLLSENAD